ncbi:unnamed protein product [Urochloa humidicola]
MDNPTRPLSILSWNVRGLGDRKKCNDVRLAIFSPPTVLCFQETKLTAVNTFKAASFLPHALASSYSFQPSIRASGGVLTTWDPSLLIQTSSIARQYTLTSAFQSTTTELAFTVTNCYAPCDAADKVFFLQELADVCQSITGAWILLGDFNMTRSPEERSNDNFDQAEAAVFNTAIDSMELQELPLLDRRFTWSNHQEVPILVKLDRFLVNNAWSVALPNSVVTSASAQTSDHCQLWLSASTSMPRPTVFRFNNHWLRIPSCLPVLQSAWHSLDDRPGSTASLVLRQKRCRADLKAWQRALPSPKDILRNCNLVIAMLDLLEEARPLYHAEATLRSLVREAAQEQTQQIATYWRQRGKIRGCVLGDSNSKFFHMSATIAWRKNQIKVLHLDDGTPVHAHAAKASLLH